MAGTRWVQKQVLEKFPKMDVRAYAVWFNMYPGDARAEWPPDLLSDPRALHRWDEQKVIGTFFGRNRDRIAPQLEVNSSWNGEILWDAYLLYGRDARWEDFPTGLIHWGRTIVAGRETLLQDVTNIANAPPVAKR